MTTPRAQLTTERLLDAIHARDAAAAGACFAAEGTWANVPHPGVHGPEGVAAMLARILDRSERVQWDIVTAAYTDDRAWLERVDRFWIDGAEYAAPCNGVVEVDVSTGLITAFRDYVDLGVWRAKVGDALSGGAAGPSAT